MPNPGALHVYSNHYDNGLVESSHASIHENIAKAWEMIHRENDGSNSHMKLQRCSDTAVHK